MGVPEYNVTTATGDGRAAAALERIATALEGLLDVQVARAASHRFPFGIARDLVHLMTHRQQAEVMSRDYAKRPPRPTPSSGERQG
jgi:hypothetical protein